jgi:hypothetical protein
MTYWLGRKSDSVGSIPSILERHMPLWKPDPTFYPSPSQAAEAPPETLTYVAAFDRAAARPDAIAVLDTDPASSAYGTVVGWTDLPNLGDELHHFCWNACSSALCDQFYPDGVGAWLAKIDVDTANGGMRLDERFFPHGDDFRGLRVHQTRLQGGDASSDSYCFP